MIRSMTGFGASMTETGFGRLAIEIRSLNNRFLDLNVRLGSSFVHLDQKARSVVRDRIARGKVDVTLRFDPADNMVPQVRINEALYKSIKESLVMVDSTISVSAGDLLSIPGVLLTGSADRQIEELDEEIMTLLNQGLDALEKAREAEGVMLLENFQGHRNIMSERLTHIVELQHEVTAKYRERLHSRIDELMKQHGATLDQGRLELEVAIFADKADITEEVNRLGGHLEALGKILDSKKVESGKALEFLAQEILREVNTIGSKCRDLEIARHVIDLKQELESLRENLANVE